jgi:hypothetical protein
MASNTQRVNNLLGAGTYAVDILPKYRNEATLVGAREIILTEGRVDFNKMTTDGGSGLSGHGVLDISPLPQEIQMVFGMAGKEEIAQISKQYWEGVANSMVDRFSTAQERAELFDSQCLWSQGLGTGHAAIADHTVRKLKKIQPRLNIAADVIIPNDWDKLDERVISGYNLFTSLWEEGIIQGAILTDNNSPFAKAYTLKVADSFKASGLMACLMAPRQFKQNRGIVEVVISLGDFSPFAGMAFASETLAIKKQTFWWPLLKPLNGWVPKGTLSIPNIIIKSKEAFEQALRNPNCRAIDENIDIDKPFFAVFSIPLGVSELWSDISAQIRSWMSIKYPTAVPIFTSAAGRPMPQTNAAYNVQCTLIYPLPQNPAVIVEIIGRKNLKTRRRRLNSEVKIIKLEGDITEETFSKTLQWNKAKKSS